MSYHPTTPTLTMNGYRTLTGTTVYTNSLLTNFNLYHYGVFSGDKFGSDTSSQNAAIVKFGNSIVMNKA